MRRDLLCYLICIHLDQYGKLNHRRKKPFSLHSFLIKQSPSKKNVSIYHDGAKIYIDLVLLLYLVDVHYREIKLLTVHMMEIF